MLLAWFSLLPIFILVGFITLILFHRDLHTVRPSPSDLLGVTFLPLLLQIFYLAGVVLNEGINLVIKHIIKEPRPASGSCKYYCTPILCSYCTVQGKWNNLEEKVLTVALLHGNFHGSPVVERRC